LHKTPCWLPLYGFENRVFQNRKLFWDSEETPQNGRTNAAENKLKVLKMSPPKFLNGRKMPSAVKFASTVHCFEGFKNTGNVSAFCFRNWFLFQRLKPACQLFGGQKMRWETEPLHPKNCVLSKSLDAENLRKTVRPQADRTKKRWPKLQPPTFTPPKTEGQKRFYKFKNRLSPNKPATEIMCQNFW
jgi:hypothetical protein